METGIVLYNIELDGCLNGVYTNDHVDGDIFNEIARRHTNIGEDDLSGIYDCFYFDINNSRIDAELTIGIKSNKNRTYAFSWEVKGKIIFEGIGYRMNEKQVAVHYWQK